MAAMPRKYADGAIQEAPPNTAPARRAMIGSFAEHGMKVVVIIVIRRSRSFSIVLEAMTPGTPQPEPISIGIKDLPERPKRRKIRSRMKAILAMYPQPSRKARKKNRTSICGRKPSTAPIPATIPSRTRLVNTSPVPSALRIPSKRPGIDGSSQRPKKDHGSEPNRTSLTQSVPIAPIVEMEM